MAILHRKGTHKKSAFPLYILGMAAIVLMAVWVKPIVPVDRQTISPMIGGVVCDYFAKKTFDTFWTLLHPLDSLQTNGFNWARVGVLTTSSNDLKTTPVAQWSTLAWKHEYWSSLEYAEQILLEAQNRGMKLNLFFYLSDEAAYGSHQNAPPEWEGLTVAETAAALDDYCYNTAKYFKDKGIEIDVYDIGNEIEMGILNFLPGDRVALPPGTNLWTDMNYMRNNIWSIEATMLKGAIGGVKRADPEAKVVLHITGLGQSVNNLFVHTFFQTMIDNAVPFDYAGLSWPYDAPVVRPYFNTAELANTILFLQGLGKMVIFSEYSYPNSPTGISEAPAPGYPYSPQGQADWVRDFISFCYAKKVLGLFYFYPEYFPGMSYGSTESLESGGLFASDTQTRPAQQEFVIKKDLLGTWTGQGVYYRNSDTASWSYLGSAATKITTGDLDGDRVSDLIGIWPTQGGVWAKYSGDGQWARLSSTADWIGAGDMNGDGKEDLLGTWAGQGVYFRDSETGNWVQLASPADKTTCGDLDDDGIDDLIGIWPAQGGVWVKYSSTGNWENLSSTADWIDSGDLTGDGRDDFLGSWAGQGVYCLDPSNGQWIQMSSPATQIACGDVDGDRVADLIGIWPTQGGVWVKSSFMTQWFQLSSTADWIACGRMRGASGDGDASAAALGALGGAGDFRNEIIPPNMGFVDLIDSGPGGRRFSCDAEPNLSPRESGSPAHRIPGPGEPGFACSYQKNLVPAKGFSRERERK
jgi:arabinogalactan endo-1,4-beta-galactosidase